MKNHKGEEMTQEQIRIRRKVMALLAEKTLTASESRHLLDILARLGALK